MLPEDVLVSRGMLLEGRLLVASAVGEWKWVAKVH